MAVASERQGGTHFVALDITDTTTPTAPLDVPAALHAGRAALGADLRPILAAPAADGPVLLQTDGHRRPAELRLQPPRNAGRCSSTAATSPTSTAGTRRRSSTSTPAVPLSSPSTSPLPASERSARWAMRFGFPATAAMVDYGRASAFEQTVFDTAVVGDEGGQPGRSASASPAPARRQCDHRQWPAQLDLRACLRAGHARQDGGRRPGRKHQPIYTVASATTVQQETGWLRAFVGSGDRAHVRSTGGGDCRPTIR